VNDMSRRPANGQCPDEYGAFRMADPADPRPLLLLINSMCADYREWALRGLHRASHAVTGIGDQLVGQLTHAVVSTSVPTRSPDTIRSMLRSSSMLKT